MKASIWCLLFVLLLCLGLASTLNIYTYGQDVKSTHTLAPSTEQAIPIKSAQQSDRDTQPLLHSCSAGCPAGKVDPVIAKYRRFISLFIELRSWEDLAKQYDEADNAMLEEYWRAYLEKRSGLTAVESEQVKKIAFRYLQEEQALKQKYQNYRAMPAKNYRAMPAKSLELHAFDKADIDLVSGAIAQLATVLGPESYNNLDLFTLHMHDITIATPVPTKPSAGVTPQ